MSEGIQPEGQKYDEQDFINFSCLNLTFPLENDPINKLKYILPKLEKDNIERKPEQWFGYCKHSNEKVSLDSLYVNEIFPPDLVADVKAFDFKGNQKWIGIPP